ncbi:MAG: hypothetical protein GEU78_17500 [Actinobacteria bacterium]|nr:hypothetical protein [Actinomycetota bacterium]
MEHEIKCGDCEHIAIGSDAAEAWDSFLNHGVGRAHRPADSSLIDDNLRPVLERAGRRDRVLDGLARVAGVTREDLAAVLGVALPAPVELES